ncbi:MAG TPA: FUSC family protein, partial [Rhodopila sp.]|nr:FUSC family protein [Rhodopila sp.]
MSWPSIRDWLFACKAFLAAMLALYVAVSLGLQRPYWAMASAYIAMQPLSGATRSKAIFRGCGTIAGASAAVVLVPPLSNAPALLSLALALWTGVC